MLSRTSMIKSVYRTLPHSLSLILMLAAGIISAPVYSGTQTDPKQDPKSAAAPAATTIDTESIINTNSALDRTRPFPIADKREYFTNIKDGDKVKSPFRVSFSVSGMGVSPVAAGKIEGTGHHHILIDMPFPADIKAPIPFDKPDEYLHQHYKHFGKGETEAILNLPPGKHTLQLLFADERHIPYYIRSNQITIEVTK